MEKTALGVPKAFRFPSPGWVKCLILLVGLEKWAEMGRLAEDQPGNGPWFLVGLKL
jgi:hypothetical protein